MDCSIIIPVFNKVELTRQCLEHLAAVTDSPSYEVVIVDNASTDGTAELCARLGGDVQVITNAENLGFARACNQGAAAARGRWLVFLNNDTVPLPGWLSAMVAEVERDSGIAVVGSRLLYADGTIQHAGVVFSRERRLPYHPYKRFAADAPEVSRRRELQAVTAACMLVRPEAFRAVGGFDEGFRNGYEDVDLCLKIRARGGRVVYQPRSTLYHLESQTPGRLAYEDRNRERLLRRWRGALLADEDLRYVGDGWALRRRADGAWVRWELVRLRDPAERARWERLALVQHLGLAGDRIGIRPLLEDVGGWPEDAGALRWAAVVCHWAGVGELAEAFWRRALELEEAPDLRAALARASLQQGELEAADAHVDALLARAPVDGSGWLLRGLVAEARGDGAMADAAYETALLNGVEPPARWRRRGRTSNASRPRALVVTANGGFAQWPLCLEIAACLRDRGWDATLVNGANLERAGRRAREALERRPPELVIGYNYSSILPFENTDLFSALGIPNACWFFDDPFGHYDARAADPAFRRRVLDRPLGWCFVWDRSLAEQLASEGGRVEYLPLGYLAHAIGVPDEPPPSPTCEVGVLGNIGNAARHAILEELARLPIRLAVHTAWDLGFPVSPELRRALRPPLVTDAERAAFFRRCAVYLETPSNSGRTAINVKTLNAMACGAFVLAPASPEIPLHFSRDEIATYAGPRDLVAQLARYLGDEPARRAVARAGCRAVRERHAMAVRVDALLRAVGKARSVARTAS